LFGIRGSYNIGGPDGIGGADGKAGENCMKALVDLHNITLKNKIKIPRKPNKKKI